MGDAAQDSPHLEPRSDALRRRVLGPPLIVLALLCVLAAGSMRMLGAARGYVGGESLWSKARASAVQHLLNYCDSGDPNDFARFESALTVPEGDRAAREALLTAHPDAQAAREGFLAGDIHPGDVDNMIWVLRWFGHSWMFRDAVTAWTEGDALILELKSVAATVHKEMTPPQGPRGELGKAQLSAARREALVAQIKGLSNALLAHELRFIGALGDTGRRLESLLLVALIGSAAVLSVWWLWLTDRALRRQGLREAALQVSKRRWELAAASAGLGRFDLDPATQSYELDAVGAELMGLAPQHCVLSRDQARACLHPDDRPRCQAATDAALHHGTPMHLRLRTCAGDGRQRHLECVGRLEHLSSHEDPHVIGVLRDVSEDVVRAQMSVAKDAAERIASAQRAFLSRLSHELRTPLNAILGFAQLLELDHDAALTPAQRQQVEWILGAGRQLLHLVEDVMDLSKVESGELRLCPQVLDVQSVLRACLPLIEPVRRSRHVEVVDALPSAPLWVWADAQRLQQVFINLLSNGCKYNRDGGRLSLSARTDGDDHIVVDVGDMGAGLTPQEITELFQPFKRMSKTAGQVEGTGLGLYIVRQLLERMHGSVTVVSEPGQGSCFSIRLPVPHHAPPSPTANGDPSQARPLAREGERDRRAATAPLELHPR